jgi:hypothetical protein
MSQPGALGSPSYRLCLLGAPTLSDASGQVPPGLGPGKPLALLGYLALTGGARREAVVALLWGDVSESRARNAFRQTLHRLRSTLGEAIIPQDGELLRLSAEAVSCDVHEFDSHIEQRRFSEAIALYRGELFEGLSISFYFDHHDYDWTMYLMYNPSSTDFSSPLLPSFGTSCVNTIFIVVLRLTLLSSDGCLPKSTHPM